MRRNINFQVVTLSTDIFASERLCDFENKNKKMSSFSKLKTIEPTAELLQWLTEATETISPLFLESCTNFDVSEKTKNISQATESNRA